MKRICDLGRGSAIEIIKDSTEVFYKSGVWNPYQLTPTERAIEGIRRSGYGADVSVDDDGNYYVSVPCDSDMW